MEGSCRRRINGGIGLGMPRSTVNTNPTGRSSERRAGNALRIVGGVLLSVLTFGLLIGGAGILSSVIPGSKVVGAACLGIATVVLVFTVERWAKMLPGLLFLATINALLMAASGHLLNNPSVPVAPQKALTAAALTALSCVLSLHFHDMRLGTMHRAALLFFVACLVWGMLSSFHILPLVLGTAGLGSAWAYDRVRGP